MGNLETLAIWENWFRSFVIEDIRKALNLEARNQPSLEIGLIILSLLGIEALSGYFACKDADKKTFVNFIAEYFPHAYTSYSNEIYASLRNGLAHDYVIKEIDIGGKKVNPFLLTGKVGEPHLVPVSPPNSFPIAFNRIAIAQDFLSSWEKYLADVYGDPNLLQKLVDRVKQRGFMMVGPFPP